MSQNNEIINNEEPRKYLLNEESYALLNAAQNKIFEAAEIIVPVRKMINALVTPEAAEEMTQTLIKKHEE